jgi:hypothetical protein
VVSSPGGVKPRTAPSRFFEAQKSFSKESLGLRENGEERIKTFRAITIVACLGVFTILGVLPSHSQIVTCTPTGTVFDPSHSLLSGVSVTATNAGTNFARS